MRIVLIAACVALGPATTFASPQDPTAPVGRLPSGPAIGTRLHPVVVFAPSGPRAGTEFDAAATGGRPTALLFVHELTRNVAPVIRAFDSIAASHRVLGLEATTVFLSADRSAAERQIATTSGALRLAHPIAVSVDGAEGPGNLALNRRCTLTLVVANGGDVHGTIGFTDTAPQDGDVVRAAIEAVTGTVPTDPGELRRIAMQRLPTDPDALRALAAQLALEQHWISQRPEPAQRRDAAMRERPMRGEREMQPGAAEPATTDAPRRAREGAPPSDSELQSLLRSFIRKDAPAERVTDVFDRIVARVGDDAELRRQAVEMFRLMLSLDYGGDAARDKARAYVAEHGGSAPAPGTPTPVRRDGGR